MTGGWTTDWWKMEGEDGWMDDVRIGNGGTHERRNLFLPGDWPSLLPPASSGLREPGTVPFPLGRPLSPQAVL